MNLLRKSYRFVAPFTKTYRMFSQSVETSHSESQGDKININLGVDPKKPRGIYLDTQATSQLDFRVLDAMLPYMTNMFGNPHSKSHEYGWETENAIKDAREKVAKLINADSKEIIFTSGATESNNLALKGLAKFYKKKKHIITTQTEHKCILDTCRHLEDEGLEVTYLPVQKSGLIDLEHLRTAIRPDTLAVSVMLVHNEIGVIQDIKEIGKICRDNKVFLHTDAAQAVGKIPVDVKDMNIDLMSISGHKLYGPKGIGALYRRVPKVKMLRKARKFSLNSSNDQRRRTGKGYEKWNFVPSRLGEACAIAQREMVHDQKHIKKLYDKLLNGLQQIPEVFVNGSIDRRYHGNLNISFAFIEGESLIMGIKRCAVSSGSACTSESLEPSYVLRAIGVDDELAHTSIRFGLSRFTTEEEIDFLIEDVTKAVNKLRDMSPLWEMHQEGIDISKVEWTQPH